MAITAQEVNKLRQITGAGMMDCKKALTEADGDIEKAIDILRKKGQKVSASRSDRETTEGAVFIKTSEDGRRSVATEAVLITLTCETDFVAKNEDFQTAGQKIVEIAFEQRPNTVEDLLQLKFDGSSHDNLTVGEKIVELVGKIGEKIEIGAYESLKGEVVVPYIHSNSKLGVIVALKNVEGSDRRADVTEAGKNVAMQIAAMRPVAVDKDGVDQATIDRELEIGREQAVAEGKPEHILDKIAQGKLNKFFKDSTLLNQDYVKDPGTTVAKYLDSVSKGLTVSAFKRIAIGE